MAQISLSSGNLSGRMSTNAWYRRHARSRKRAGICRLCSQPPWRKRANLCSSHRRKRTSYMRQLSRAENPQRKSDRIRAATLKSKFGLTVAEYEQIFTAQGGMCAICQKPPKKNRLSVDHRHADGVLRGLLCWKCNRSIGGFADDPVRLRRAADYLDSPPIPRILGRVVVGKRGR